MFKMKKKIHQIVFTKKKMYLIVFMKNKNKNNVKILIRQKKNYYKIQLNYKK